MASNMNSVVHGINGVQEFMMYVWFFRNIQMINTSLITFFNRLLLPDDRAAVGPGGGGSTGSKPGEGQGSWAQGGSTVLVSETRC